MNLLLATSTVKTVGAVVAVLAMIGFAVYVVTNLLAARAEVGSEIELAPNRKPYYDDEQLETKKLTRTLFSGMVLLGVTAIGLPLYWLAEPGREKGAIEDFQRIFEKRGLEQYETGSACVNCHTAEGKGGSAPYTILDANGAFVASVNWLAPALDTVLLRFSREELAEIIEFGRPGTPMPAWGARGGGPRSEQQIEDLIYYLASIQKTSDEAKHAAEVQLAIELGLLQSDQSEDDAAVEAALDQIDYEDLRTGETLFHLGLDPIFAGGAYSCARCHEGGAAIVTEGEDAIQGNTLDGIASYVDYEPGSGSFGPPLDGVVPRQFASVDELAEFVSLGNAYGIGFGKNQQGDGMMPGYGDNPNTETVAGDGMLTPEMICSIARYVTTLQGGEGSSGEVPTTVPPASTTTTTQADDDGSDDAAADEAPAEETAPYCEAAAQSSGEE